MEISARNEVRWSSEKTLRAGCEVMLVISGTQMAARGFDGLRRAASAGDGVKKRLLELATKRGFHDKRSSVICGHEDPDGQRWTSKMVWP